MIDRARLLSDLQKLLQRLEADLLERSASAEVPEVGSTLRSEYDRAKTAQRTAQNYEDWRSDNVTQTAAAWVLSCVFVRFLEDNCLVEPPKIAGPGERLQRARDEHELYFHKHPRETDRHYLLAIFDELARLPGTKDVFGAHNPIRELPNWLSGDAAGELLRFFQKIEAGTGALVHDFTDPAWDTRFLGDLYQDLSEAARKKYALLQTPEFVEEFILDRTLDPALDEFGLTPGLLSTGHLPLTTDHCFRMIDPACGSGHFLLGAFPRLLARWLKKEPGANLRVLVQRALDSIHGVDVNPYAIAIARFRLLLAAMRACQITRLADAPAFQLNLACGDSLLHAPLRASATEGQKVLDFELTSGDGECDHAYMSEDLPALKRMLRAGTYHAVVANPPYIVPRDRQLNDRYRQRFTSCHMKYSLAVPFMEQIFRLAMRSEKSAGYTGQITANSFMKREFGKKLVEQFLPTVNLTHVVDTSGAYVPGHGTPTVILFGRNCPHVATTLRTVMGITGEPAAPDHPAQGLVWTAITKQIDMAGSTSEYVSVGDSPRGQFEKHPWSIGGGGAAELKERLDESTAICVRDLADCIGFGAILGDDDAFGDIATAPRMRILPLPNKRPVVEGDQVRDWQVNPESVVLFPYSPDIRLCGEALVARWLWPLRAVLSGRRDFSKKTYKECGRPYWEYHQVPVDRNRIPLSITYGEVATHNHFVLDRGGKVFNRTAPVIKLPVGTTEDDHVVLVALLNSSISCFWLKQVCHNKGSTVDQHGARQRTAPFEDFFAFNATKVEQLPLPAKRPLKLARRIDSIAKEYKDSLADAVCNRAVPTVATLARAREQAHHLRGQMITLQKELDWQCYHLYGLADETYHNPNLDLAIELGQRAFQIVLARQMAAGEVETTWFARHGSTPITEVPAQWPADYRALVQRRIELIERDKNIGLIEKPEYKRRWNTEPWDEQQERALRSWLLNRLESYFDFDGRMNDEARPTAEVDIGLVSVAQLAHIAGRDPDFHQVGAILQEDVAFDVAHLVAELVAGECVPLLPILRYKASGLRKRAEWEATWQLQRREDAGEQVGDIPVPPKYTSADFIASDGARYWALRGKLDVPKERWVSFPHCEGPDGTLVIAWAGYDHLQLARAISAYYVRAQTEFGGTDDARLVPLLACLVELLPWLKQWHNEPDPAFDGMRMGDYFEGFVTEEARQLNQTLPEIKAWSPPVRTGGRGRRKQP
jgi:hypothetical protein